MATNLEVESRIYASVARELAGNWNTRADALDEHSDSDTDAAMAFVLRRCATTIIGLCDIADAQALAALTDAGTDPSAEYGAAPVAAAQS